MPLRSSEFGTRSFLRWVWPQGHSPPVSCICQKYLRPHRHSPLKWRLRPGVMVPCDRRKSPINKPHLTRSKPQPDAADQSVTNRLESQPVTVLKTEYNWVFVLHPTTGQVQHKAFFKVGPVAGPQSTRVRQWPKIPLALLVFPLILFGILVSHSLLSIFFGIVSRPPIINITVTFMLPNLFNPLLKSWYLFHFSLFFAFSLSPSEMMKSTS